eukprot:scaffold20793_cov22-Tisochrysis_lutea.AAC.2
MFLRAVGCDPWVVVVKCASSSGVGERGEETAGDVLLVCLEWERQCRSCPARPAHVQAGPCLSVLRMGWAGQCR